MKLTSIRLCNFRSFYGKTPEIVLAGGTNRNTTIMHGNNGAGKTSFLNAFTWVLYEKFSAAFASAEQLVNKRAIAEANIQEVIECWVEVFWEHDNKRYRVKRECRVYKNETNFDAGKTQLFMQVAGDDGRWYPSPQHPEDVINQILPVSLHQYFFFDGERIEQIVRSDKKAEIAEATKIFLGVKVIDNSIRHLSEAKKTLENDLKAIGDAPTKELLRQRQKTEIEIEQIRQRQSELLQELEYQQTLKQETSNYLRELAAAKELQERRQNLENQKKTNQEDLRQSRETLKKIISTRGYSVLLSSTTNQFREIIADLKQRGELTAGISQEFVQELLRDRRCICGTQLDDGSDAHQNVKNLLNQAGSSAIQETVIRTIAQVDEIDKQATAFWEDVDREQLRITQLRESISQIEAELDNVQDRLRKDPSEEIRRLQSRLDDIERTIAELNIEQGEKNQKIEASKAEAAELDKQIAKQRFNEERQVIAQRRIAATLDAIERLTEVKYRQEKQFRLQLEKRIQEIFNEISITPYIPKISDKYELTLIENTSGVEAPVAASTGENQILSLSFISSIIDKVREWSQRKILMVADSSTFPIVMDSPFGSLDETYRRQIAKIIPRLADQLIVLVTNTQWRGEVEAEIKNKIGSEYVLTYYSSKPDCEEDTLEIAGQQYPLVRRSSNEFEYTEILEVNRAG
ncbi:AAA family ATPase [Gloeocapsopsis crepidinum LEGE 06123]|uniref:Nuclease SbcCD subunit C n=1 Tax=Gloeocapsopsis crepidinum LEGE 06123 TaxID=588587 RepID=A0ABR9URF7_9CHRO|nr:AAA family ATPase [Gloeocapsopsis crepidinum]MBE9190844.1 AAA family ATPase [Gloeocapsopsis crepidinum LEGE 06123]